MYTYDKHLKVQRQKELEEETKRRQKLADPAHRVSSALPGRRYLRWTCCPSSLPSLAVGCPAYRMINGGSLTTNAFSYCLSIQLCCTCTSSLRTST
jgi:hypothetical protein